MLYQVEVIISLKKGIRDPEAETIHKHLILRKGFDSIKSVRAGKYLLFSVDTDSPEKALEIVKTMCEKLRIYNPVIHDIEVRLSG
ncbi:phosphoribosylformylglycinamidine synthase, purS [Ignisphaera aggregans DSM 17230]|uniref:Phosphoribosylformylglycinamidine synthase subunit PurS n=1 Tax=Ignisphaera aggregans (strain DSM 17230 / JCM 13409 / AQ1.S1) TaxID=583356 RepID=E0SQN7_IGNAA|nr:phosphoribosylformylglycinamidine synthase, purS [Ignisphaera aggregans DSM 17230]